MFFVIPSLPIRSPADPAKDETADKGNQSTQLHTTRMDVDKGVEPEVSKKRELRAGARKVTSLTAEQLERKRANDREAQRTIRLRTKEHIEGLESQVAQMKAKVEQYDGLVQRNAALTADIRRLEHQLAKFTGNGK